MAGEGPLASLPSELLVLILRWNAFPSSLRLKRVSRAFLSALSGNHFKVESLRTTGVSLCSANDVIALLFTPQVGECAAAFARATGVVSWTSLVWDGQASSTRFVSLPKSLGLAVPGLVSLSLTNCNMRGSIPTALPATLELLDLSFNALEGPMPPLVECINLKTLHLQRNMLYGQIPLTLPPSLVHLNLSSNCLSGPIPSLPVQLRNLDLSQNKLSGSIPASLGNLDSLVFLDLSFNRFKSPIPDWIGTMRNLKDLGMMQCGLVGSIPRELGEGCRALQRLNLSHNNLQGTIPFTLGFLVQLNELSLNGNCLNGMIPAEFGQLNNLWFLRLIGGTPGNAGLIDRIPDGISEGTRMWDLLKGQGFSSEHTASHALI